MAAHAASEFVAYLDTAAADHVRILDRDNVLLQGGNGFGYLPSRARRVASLDRPVVKRPLFILPVGRDYLSPLRRLAALYEDVRVERRQGRHHEDLAVVRVHRDDRSAFGRRFRKFLLGGELKVEVDGRDEVLARLRLDDTYLALN